MEKGKTITKWRVEYKDPLTGWYGKFDTYGDKNEDKARREAQGENHRLIKVEETLVEP